MPPKKKQDEEKPILIGRIGTNLKCGIVGIPNVGKSTFFNVLTKSQAAAENFPFCTIDPNESRVPVPDPRYDFLCDYFKPLSKVPSFLNVVDIAGLVKGAHEGQGLGNAFLSHIKACDALFHMCRIFEDDEVTHVEGEVNPVRDMEIIHEELRLKDVEYLEKNLDHLERTVVRGADKTKKAEYDALKKVHTLLVEEKRPVRFGTWDVKEVDELNKHMFITSKPMIYLVNMSEKDYIRKKNKWLPKIKEWIDHHDPGSVIIPFSGSLELKLMDMSPDEKEAYLKEQQTTRLGTGTAGLQAVEEFSKSMQRILKLIANLEVEEFEKGTKAPQAAGKIHTDFEKGFIMAEVMKYDDFKVEGSEVAVKAAGKYKQKGRDYIVEDGDIIHFKFNAGAGLTAAAAKKK